ncbi:MULTISPECIES: hypothetical protein [unclassified Acinetobacter]|uniref:hypothetical protein n=1 Tax=unclassified Acinetobacter TaxID=196816 RepID=UPI0015D431CD|nr:MULTISPECIES: hypothetical protein [unclassified Acinetobacter]UUS59478.1 hypothetical protein MST17_08630 [Acinetobacter sp. YH16056_T]
MSNTESNFKSEPENSEKTPFMKTNMPLAIGAVVLALSSGLLGYSIGHRQGLTVVGYDADAEQLVDVVQKQKTELAGLNKSLNAAIQERDVAVSNSNDLYLAVKKARDDQELTGNLGVLYREVLRQRGGMPLAVQHLAIKSLPENAYEYQLDLVQVSPSKSNVSGSVELRLIKGTEVLAVPLEDKNFNFSESERLTGRWTMPKGFSPDFIEVRLTGSKPVIRRFSWSKGQPVENQSAFLSEIPQTEASAN